MPKQLRSPSCELHFQKFEVDVYKDCTSGETGRSQIFISGNSKFFVTRRRCGETGEAKFSSVETVLVVLDRDMFKFTISVNFFIFLAFSLRIS